MKVIMFILGGLLLAGTLAYAIFSGEEKKSYMVEVEEPQQVLTEERISKQNQRKKPIEDKEVERTAYVQENKVEIQNAVEDKQPEEVTETPVNFDTKSAATKTIAPLKVFPNMAARQENIIKSDLWMPSHRLIKCRTVNTVQSIFPNNPLIAIITEDVYHHGKLLFKKGTEIHGTASSTRYTNRLAPSNGWKVVFDDGRELAFNAAALQRGDEEMDLRTEMSAGIEGVLKERDPEELKKLMVLTGISGGLEALEDRATNSYGDQYSTSSPRNAAIESISKPIDVWVGRQFDRLGNDPYFVEVRGGTSFYLYTMTPVDVSDAKVGAIKTKESN